ncbi:MAG: bifunctional DNA primase/polymerase [Candidatus Levyibacteriota bacterium]
MVPDPRPADEIHAAARAYLARGWSVIPVESRGKRPRVAWTEFQHRLPAQAEVDQWFRRWPDANIGIVCGRVSGLVVVDVDPRHGGERSLRELERAFGPLPRSVEAATGGGGRHLYFAHPGGTVTNRVGVAPGIDLRADGGCVVAPPSVHASGRRYAWVAAQGPGECPLAPAPAWIGAPALRARHTRRHWRDLVRAGVPEGQRNASLASLAGRLLWHGVDEEVVLELLLAWNRQRCRPPLPDEEVAAVVASIGRLHSSAGLS